MAVRGVFGTWRAWGSGPGLSYAGSALQAATGYTKTDLNRNSGFRSAAEGAEASVYLATLPADGPSGILWGHLWTADGPPGAYGRLPW